MAEWIVMDGHGMTRREYLDWLAEEPCWCADGRAMRYEVISEDSVNVFRTTKPVDARKIEDAMWVYEGVWHLADERLVAPA
jgi:hypothetical protein